MNILITGISGQIGSRLSGLLKKNGVPHFGISRDSDRLPEVKCIEADLSKITTNELKQNCQNISHVIYLADVINDSADFNNDLDCQFQNCCLNTIKLTSCLPNTIKHFSFASSYSVYGFPEGAILSEKSEINPQNVYSFTKLATEHYLNFFRKKINIPVSILRIASVYGPNPKKENQYRSIPNIINTVIRNENPYVTGSGKTYRDYTYIDDCASAIINASLLNADGVFNIGSGRKTSILEIAEEVVNISGKKLHIEHRYAEDEQSSCVCDISKMKNELNYSPKFSIKDGLKLTYDWHNR